MASWLPSVVLVLGFCLLLIGRANWRVLLPYQLVFVVLVIAGLFVDAVPLNHWEIMGQYGRLSYFASTVLLMIRQVFPTILRLTPTAIAAVTLFAGCQKPKALGERSEFESRPFTASYALIDTATLEQPDSALIVRVSGFAVSPDGEMAVADVSEANVKVYDRKGKLKDIVGRKGQGPGEFVEPRWPVFANSQIIVAEGIGRFQVFDRMGEVQREFTLENTSFITGWRPYGEEFLALRQLKGEFRLTAFDSLGKVSRELFAMKNIPVAVEPGNPTWRGLHQVWFTLKGDTAYVTSTLSDSLWKVSISDTSVSVEQMAFKGYLPPRLPTEMEKKDRNPFAWANNFHRAAPSIASSTTVVAPFVAGILNYGDPNISLILDSANERVAAENAPPILGVVGDTLYALHNASRESATVTIARYAPVKR